MVQRTFLPFENQLRQLPPLPSASEFNKNLAAEILVPSKEFESLSTGTPAIERIHFVMMRSTFYAQLLS